MSFQALQLRSTFDKKKQSQSLEDQITNRHKGYLQEMLVSKFLIKNSLDQILNNNSVENQETEESEKFRNH